MPSAQKAKHFKTFSNNFVFSPHFLKPASNLLFKISIGVFAVFWSVFLWQINRCFCGGLILEGGAEGGDSGGNVVRVLAQTLYE
jgi:hypothetical protein